MMNNAQICEEAAPMMDAADAPQFAVSDAGVRRIVEQVVATDVRFVVLVVGERVVQAERVKRAIRRVKHAPYVRIVDADEHAADPRLRATYAVHLSAPRLVCGALLMNTVDDSFYDAVVDPDGCDALPPQSEWPAVYGRAYLADAWRVCAQFVPRALGMDVHRRLRVAAEQFSGLGRISSQPALVFVNSDAHARHLVDCMARVRGTSSGSIIRNVRARKIDARTVCLTFDKGTARTVRVRLYDEPLDVSQVHQCSVWLVLRGAYDRKAVQRVWDAAKTRRVVNLSGRPSPRFAGTTLDEANLQKMAYEHRGHLMMAARRRGDNEVDAACFAVQNDTSAVAKMTAAVPYWRDLWIGSSRRGVECRLDKYDETEIYFCFVFGAHTQCSIDATLAELERDCDVEDDPQAERGFVSKRVRRRCWWSGDPVYAKRAVFLSADQLESVLGRGRIVVYGHEYEPELEHARGLARSYSDVDIVELPPWCQDYCPCVKCK